MQNRRSFIATVVSTVFTSRLAQARAADLDGLSRIEKTMHDFVLQRMMDDDGLCVLIDAHLMRVPRVTQAAQGLRKPAGHVMTALLDHGEEALDAPMRQLQRGVILDHAMADDLAQRKLAGGHEGILIRQAARLVGRVLKHVDDSALVSLGQVLVRPRGLGRGTQERAAQSVVIHHATHHEVVHDLLDR